MQIYLFQDSLDNDKIIILTLESKWEFKKYISIPIDIFSYDNSLKLSWYCIKIARKTWFSVSIPPWFIFLNGLKKQILKVPAIKQSNFYIMRHRNKNCLTYAIWFQFPNAHFRKSLKQSFSRDIIRILTIKKIVMTIARELHNSNNLLTYNFTYLSIISCFCNSKWLAA